MNSYLKKIFIINSIFIFADSLFIPLYALFVVKIGGGAELAGILFGLKFAVTALVEFFVIQLRDKYKLDEFLLKTNYLIRGLAWLLLFFMPLVPILFIAQIMIGISESLGTPAINALISEHLDKKKHLREWGIGQLTSYVPQAIAGGLSGFIIALWGFQALFLIMSILAFTALGLLSLYRKKSTVKI